MSPNVGNFVHDLVEMAKAMEMLPEVQGQYERAMTRIAQLAETVQDRELSIQQYKGEITLLNDKLRKVEAERDDAEMRFLELDEKAGKAMDRLYSLADNLEGLRSEAIGINNIILPPKPQPEPIPAATFDDGGPYNEPKPTADVAETPKEVGENVAYNYPNEPQGQGDTTPTVPSSLSDGGQTIGSTSVLDIANPEVTTSEGNPTSPATEPVDVTAQTSASGPEAVSSNTDKPYFNKHHTEVPNYVSLNAWLAGGGTERNYYL